MIYRADDGELRCSEHPEARFGTEPLGANTTSKRARQHLERHHRELARLLKSSELVRVDRPAPAPVLELPAEGRRA